MEHLIIKYVIIDYFLLLILGPRYYDVTSPATMTSLTPLLWCTTLIHSYSYPHILNINTLVSRTLLPSYPGHYYPRIPPFLIITPVGEYRIHNADITLKCDATVDDLIDVVEGNRIYIPAIYVLNKIDQISIEVFF